MLPSLPRLRSESFPSELMPPLEHTQESLVKRFRLWRKDFFGPTTQSGRAGELEVGKLDVKGIPPGRHPAGQEGRG